MTPGRRSDLVHARLRRDIVEGRLAAGDAVPSERALAEELGVNRHAVREALKRLQQAGLVRISQGGATRVLDWRQTGGLDVLLDLVDGELPPDLRRSVLEMRASIGRDAAERCADRAAPGDRDAVRALAATAAEVVGGDPAAVDEAYSTLWRAIVAGSGNLAYGLALNSLEAALAVHPEVAEAVRPADGAAVRELGEAIAAGDGGRAARAAAVLLDP